MILVDDDVWLNIPLSKKLLVKYPNVIAGHLRDAVYQLQPIRRFSKVRNNIEINIPELLCEGGCPHMDVSKNNVSTIC